MIEFKVGLNHHLVRLDQVVALNCTQYSREKLKKTIKEGGVLVNGHFCKTPSTLVSEGDLVQVSIQDSKPIETLNLPALDLLYEDPHLLVLNKSFGVTVHSGHGTAGNTLSDALAKYTVLSDFSGAERKGIVHRLDKDTEGLMVVAKTNAAHEHLMAQFKQRTVEKKYAAMVFGNVLNDEFNIEVPLGWHSKIKNKRIAVNASTLGAKEAVTLGKVLHRFGSKTLVLLTPLTGRTHQLRVHMAYFQHPILGDPVYSKYPSPHGQLLQAVSLGFTHPITGHKLRFNLPFSRRLTGK